MQTVILFAVCLVFQTLADVSTDLKPENREESLISNNLEEVDTKKEKFSYLLSLLKSAITTEENNTNIKIINKTEIGATKNNNFEQNPKEEALKILDVKKKNETDIFGKTFDKIISKISIAIDQPKNNISERKLKPKEDVEILDKDNKTDIFGKTYDKIVSAKDKPKNMSQNLEMPSMIPIFRTKPKNDNKKYYGSDKFVPRQSTKPLKSFDQADLNFKNKPTQFNIPCQRAVDILEMNPPERSTKMQMNERNLSPIDRKTESKVQNQGPKPVTISVNSKDLDESVKMEFKPKAITLMQLYGNILRKLTVTVLVPYHINISKLKPLNRSNLRLNN